MPDRLFDEDPDLHAEAETERERHRQSQPNGADRGGLDLICAAAEPHEISDIPPRQWAYGKFLIFGEVAALGAVDGGGKGAHAVTVTLSMISGRELLSERVWRTGPVAVVTYEDDEIEWRRRIAAACIHYELDYKKMINSVYFIRHPGRRVQIAARREDRVVFPDGTRSSGI